MRFFTNWQNYWKQRKINWESHYFNPDHPHRLFIIRKLMEAPFGSVVEIGCGAGANLHLIKRYFPAVKVGGVDVNEDAINEVKKKLGEGIFEVQSAESLFFSDDSVDVGLTDMALIYVSPANIKKVLTDLHKLVRKYIILVEFHHTNYLKRLWLRLKSGYHAYDYQKLLDETGYYDIRIEKIPVEAWPGGDPQKTFAYIITGRIPQ